MRIGTASDAVYTTIIWLPILAIIALCLWTLTSGVLQLEKITPGTEYFVSNAETSNMIEPLGGGTYEEQLAAALATDDPEQMQAALDRVEAQQAAIAANRLEF